VLSSRALRFVDVVSVSSTDSRPIYHRRGEPLCRGFSRIHIILGEGQASHWGLYLRLASAALVLRLVEGGADFAATLALASPVEALHLISRDPTLRQRVKMADGRELSAIEIQRGYLDRIETELSRGCLPPWASKACKRWRWTLDQLERQPDRLAGVLDWPLKRKIFAKRLARHQLSIDDIAEHSRLSLPIGRLSPGELRALRSQMLALDVQFGRLDGDGLFQQLDQAGLLDHHIPEVSEDTVARAMRNPPEGSRATLRGPERLDLLGRHEGIGAAGQDQNARGQLTRLGGRLGREQAMERRDRVEVRARPRHVEHDRATEAVTDGADLFGVDVRILRQNLARRAEPGLHDGRIGHHLLHQLLGFLGGLGVPALAVHVQRETHVAFPCEPPRLETRVLVVAPPFVHDENPRPPVRPVCVPGNQSVQRRAVLLIGDFASLHLGDCGRRRFFRS
jgi:hypothetical protein